MRKNLRFFSAFLSFLLVLSLTAPLCAAAGTPSDIRDNWAKTYIEQGLKDGWLSGYPDGTFRPNNSVTRGAFCKMLNRALGLETAAAISFSDVKSTDTFYSEIRKAVYAGYITGYADGTFRAGQTITHQQAAVMVARVVTAPSKLKSLSTLKDSASIASYARTGVQKVLSKGYVALDSAGRFSPTARQTRAQTAKIIGSMAKGETIVRSAVTVSTSGKTLSDTIYTKAVTITSAASGATSVSNCCLLGSLNARSGGTVLLKNSNVTALNINGGGKTAVSASGTSSVTSTWLSAGAALTESGLTTGDGFNTVGLKGTALGSQPVTLRGSFTNVTVSSPVRFSLASGSVKTLGVMQAAAGSSFALAAGTKIDSAVINGAAAFTGAGAITAAVQNVSGVTYETKPGKITGTGAESGGVLTPVMTPADGSTGVSTAASVKLTFSEALYNASGKALTAADAAGGGLELRKGSSSGSTVIYSAVVSTDRKSITITPASALSGKTSYYVILKAGTLKNSAGTANPAVMLQFTTAANSSSTVSISSGTTGVSVAKPDVTLAFTEPMYLRGSLSGITLRRTDTAVSVPCTVAFTAGNRSAVVTAEDTLADGTQYQIVIPAGTFRNAAGVSLPAATLNFTTAAVSASVSITGIEATATSVSVTFRSATAGSAIVSLTGQTSKSVSVTAGNSCTVRFDGLTPSTGYDAAVIVKPADGTASVSDLRSFTTKTPGVTLTNLLTGTNTATVRVACDYPGTVVLTCSPAATLSLSQIRFENAGSIDVNLTSLKSGTAYTVTAVLTFTGGTARSASTLTTAAQSGAGGLSSFQIIVPNNPVILYSNPKQSVTCSPLTVSRGTVLSFAAAPAVSGTTVLLSASSATVTYGMTQLTVTASVYTGNTVSSVYTFLIPLNVT